MNSSTAESDVAAENVLYAKWQAKCVVLAFCALLMSFALYVSGVLPSAIPPYELPHYWGLSAERYVAATRSPTGWGWIERLGEGDVLNFAGVALLGAASFVCYLRITFHFAATRQLALLIVCVAELFVLLFAASNLIPS